MALHTDLVEETVPKEPELEPAQDNFNKNNNATESESETEKNDKVPLLTSVTDSRTVERPTQLLTQKSCDSDGMKINKLSSPSPVLGSPSVVKKARSLFDSTDSVASPEVSEKRPQWPTESSSPQVGSISKILHSFEKSHESSATTITAKNWESEVHKFSGDRVQTQQRQSSNEPEIKP